MTVSPIPVNPAHGSPGEPRPAPGSPAAARSQPAGTSLVERACAVVAAFAVLAFIVKLALAGQVVEQRRAVAERQAKITSGSVLAQVNNRLIQMLATASAEQGDLALRDLLSRSGVSFSVNQNPAQPAPATAGAQP
jgi:hypothetical protein